MTSPDRNYPSWLRYVFAEVSDALITRAQTLYNENPFTQISLDDQTKSLVVILDRTGKAPVEVHLRFEPFPGDNPVERLLTCFKKDSLSTAEFLQDRFPAHLAQTASEHGLNLYPRGLIDVHSSCTCAKAMKSGQPCSHILATLLLVGHYTSRHPDFYFKLRGIGNLRDLLQRAGILTQQSEANVKLKPFRVPALLAAMQRQLPPLKNASDADGEDASAFSQLNYANLPNLQKQMFDLFESTDTRELPCTPRFLLEHMIEEVRGWFAQSIPPADIEFEHLFEYQKSHFESHYPHRDGRIDAIYHDAPLPHLVRDANDFTFTLSDQKKGRSAIETLVEWAYALLYCPVPRGGGRQALTVLREMVHAAMRFTETLTMVPSIVRVGTQNRVFWMPALRHEAVKDIMQALMQLSAPYWTAERLKALQLDPEAPTSPSTATLMTVSVLMMALLAGRSLRVLAKKSKSPEEAQLFTYWLLFSGAANLGWQASADVEDDEGELIEAIEADIAPFMVAESWPWCPVLKVTAKGEEVYIDFGILPRDATERAASTSKTTTPAPKPVFLKKILKDKALESDRFAVITALQGLSKALPELSQLALTGQPVALEKTSLKDFLFEATPILTLLGVMVMLPKSLRTILRPKLVGTVGLNTGAKSVLSKDALSQFEWKVALGNQSLSLEDLRKLRTDSARIVAIGDTYAYLDPATLSSLVKALEERPQPTGAQALEAVLTGSVGSATFEMSKELKNKVKELKDTKLIKIPKALNAQLRPYQVRGYSWLMKNLRLGIGALIADDMGLGKTLQVIAALTKLKEDGLLTPGKTLIVVPTTLLTNWVKELGKFSPTLTHKVYHGQHRQFSGVEAAPDLYLTTYGTVRRDSSTLKTLEWDYLVLDEAQAIKSARAAQSVAIRELGAKQVIAMSGTPVENRLMEYYSILTAVMPGLLGSAESFARNYARPIEVDHDPQAVSRFKMLCAPFMLRRLKSDPTIVPDLPERTIIDHFTHLTREQVLLYKEALERGMGQIKDLQALQKKDNQTQIKQRGAVLKMIGELKAICNSPSQYLAKHPQGIDSGKGEALMEILEHCQEAKRKVLIFTQFVSMGEIIQSWVYERFGMRAQFLHGAISHEERASMVERFQNDPDQKVLVVSIRAGGTGLNLTAASAVVLYDLWWNPAVEAQASDRVYRIGQERDVVVWRFVTAGTFEERINEMLKEKQRVQELTVSVGETWLGDLDTHKLERLLKLDHLQGNA